MPSNDPEAVWRLRGIRGATTVENNTREDIIEATEELLAEMITRNDIESSEVASAWFTTTPDLNAEFPAVAARLTYRWSHAALMCSHEMDVPGSLPSCLRILLHVNTPLRQNQIQHVYLRGARVLRTDLTVNTEPSRSGGDLLRRLGREPEPYSE
ncbi:MAG: chorismate mutase [Chloroflexi bacterium]|nr:chorismate mutase [Chloroflexota bacterium]MCY3697940.1 chorismate mutase [Chloroflexota bacterium]MXX30702.1 chorismate mutase [Chloroflexota bacterium]MXX81020.1 chorismate mutase [Chloroflexota bacterium]MYB22197.1 chorismate mutase [Chloroflexota bacterium]